MSVCECGCGEKTTIIRANNTARGRVKGTPNRFVAGHQKRLRPGGEAAATFSIDGVQCRLISLSHGFYTIVDATDYEWLMQWKWHVQPYRRGFYVVRKGLVSDGQRGAQVRMHRAILGLERRDESIVDHRDCNTLNNSRSNLRLADAEKNCRNSRRRTDNTSGFKGVCMDRPNLWRVRIWHGGKRHNIGRFRSLESARAAYAAAAAKYHGEFARIA